MKSIVPVSTVTEIPLDLHQSMRRYLENHPEWDQDRLITASISLFLLQNWGSKINGNLKDYRICSRIYLETLFAEDVTINFKD